MNIDFVIIAGLLTGALAFGVPLLWASLGELLGERAGVLNIGLEGMMLCGAWAGAAAAFWFSSGIAGVAAAMLCGMALAALFAFLTISLQADAIVVGTGLNIFALGLTGVLHRALSARWGNYAAPALPEWIFYAAGACLVPSLWWMLHRTNAGLRWRACGENPAAARSAGIDVVRKRWIATLCNGALCGAGGAFLSLSNTDSFSENMTAGRGFIALAIVIFGRWNAWGALGAALLFGLAQSAQFFLQARIGTTYSPLLLALPYLLTLLTLAGFAGKARAPQALGAADER